MYLIKSNKNLFFPKNNKHSKKLNTAHRNVKPDLLSVNLSNLEIKKSQ